MDEGRAVELLKGGNLSGLESLVRLYYFKAVRISFLIVQDSDLAEDIIQNSFIHANEKISQLTSDHFGPWFLRSVVNASIKAARNQKRHVSIEASDNEADQFFMEWLVDQRPSPEEMVETEDLRQSVWQALSQLTPDQRAAVVMKYVLEMTEVEITHKLNAPLSTIKWRLFAAREKLRKLLNPSRGSYNPPESKPTHPRSEDQE